jgi:hypothetical protein
MRTTRPTDDDLRVIVQTLAVSGSLGQDDGSALLREIDALSYDLTASEARAERYRSALEQKDAALRMWLQHVHGDEPSAAACDGEVCTATRAALEAGEGADA